MNINFKALILNHKNADVVTREQVALSNDSHKSLLLRIKKEPVLTDVMVLSTCNRTEVFYVGDEEEGRLILSCLKREENLTDDVVAQFELIRDSKAAVNHLFRVAIGLESNILGDLQIPKQVKNAYQVSIECELASTVLHRVLHAVFYAHKRVVQETTFKVGMASVSFAAFDLARRKSKEFVKPKVLLIGAGEMGRGVAVNFANLDDISVSIVNRTDEKAKCLATQYHFDHIPFATLASRVKDFDIVVSSVAATSYVFFKEDIKDFNSMRHKYMIDLGMPRSLDPKLSEIPGVLTYNIDEIQSKITDDSNKRKKAIPAVESIIKDALEKYEDWSGELSLSPAIHQLKATLEGIREKELSKNLLQNMPEQTRQTIDAITKNMMKKVLKIHVLQLKNACKRGEADSLINAINELFNIEQENSKTF